MAGKHYFWNLGYSLFPSDSLYQFECSIDGQAFEQCISPKHYGDLDTEAMHIFKVRTKGILGNTQDIPTPFNFTSVTSSYVKGIVRDGDRTIMNGIVKLYELGDNPTVETKTSSQGAFSFRYVVQGIHNLTITPPPSNATNARIPHYHEFYVGAGEHFKDEGTIDISKLQNFEVTGVSFTGNDTVPVTQNIQQEAFNKTEENQKYVPEVSSLTPTPTPTDLPLLNVTDLQSIQIAQQSERLPDKTNLFKTTLSIDTNNNTLTEINKVSYYLHPTFEPSVINSTSSTDKFSITITNWGIFNLKAKVFFKDGRIVDLELPMNKWKI